MQASKAASSDVCSRVMSFDGSGATQHFVTLTIDPSVPAAEAARALCAEASELVAGLGIQPLQEKLYGRDELRSQVLAERASQLQERGLEVTPATYLDGRPAAGGNLAGLQLWGVSPRQESRQQVETLSDTGGPIRCWSGPDFRLLALSQLTGEDGGGSNGVDEQAARMFTAARAQLRACGTDYPGVVRTWIYLKRILDWYGEFNRVRTAYYQQWLPAEAEGTRVLPASTGIQGHSGSEECLMELLAAGGPGVKARPVLASARQASPLCYGVSFSRAMALEVDGLTALFVSGTASLDLQGRVLHRDLPEQQYVESMLGLASILESQGGSLEDVCSATLFCKNADVYRSCLEVSRLLQLPELPVVPVLADVCRPDLLVELEAVAIL